MKFITIASSNEQDLETQVKHLNLDGWVAPNLTPVRIGALLLMHMQKEL